MNSFFQNFNHNLRSHDISAVKLAKTEPIKKILKNNFLKADSYIPNSSSPCKTPPWKPMSSFYSYNTDNTPNGVTHKKLIFDEYEDPYRSLTPSPTDENLENLKLKSKCFYRELSASPASIGEDEDDDDESSSSSTEQLSVKLNFKL